jgi:hypothetical protein
MIIRIEKSKMYDTTISLKTYMEAEIKSVTGLDNKLEEFEITPLASDDLYQDFYINAKEKEPLDGVYMLPAGKYITFNSKQEPLSKVTELEESIPYTNIDVSTPNSMRTDEDIERFFKEHPQLLRHVLKNLTTD